MSLLTEEQIEEILEVVSDEVNVEYPISMKGELRRWNNKQTGIQFHVDWNKAPPSATRAELQIAWYNNDNFLVSEDVLAYVPRPTTPHPHAEIIAKYAEVAARRCDPWVEFEWSFGVEGNELWEVCSEVDMRFNDSRRYRHIGDKSDPMTARKGDDKPWNLNRDD